MSPKIATLIGSDKGGVGKSLVAQMIVHAYDRGGFPLSVIEIDHQRKLTSILADRVNLSLDASPALAVTTKDRLAAERFFNPIYDYWSKGDSLTDLGANVTTPLMEWARFNDIPSAADEDDVRFMFVAMTTPDDQAIRSALNAVKDSRRALGAEAEIFVLLNEFGSGLSGFKPFHGSRDWHDLMALKDTHGAHVISIPNCDSLFLEYGRAMGYTVLDILTDDSKLYEIRDRAELDKLSFNAHCRLFTRWVRDVQEGLEPLLAKAAAPTPTRMAAE